MTGVLPGREGRKDSQREEAQVRTEAETGGSQGPEGRLVTLETRKGQGRALTLQALEKA